MNRMPISASAVFTKREPRNTGLVQPRNGRVMFSVPDPQAASGTRLALSLRKHLRAA
ncbi:MAG: hypothetical protein KIS81_03465 [Maricaulaceae bacterium]|nr:hypothetical protein [Maricaulaceae bacterium]